MIDFQDKRLWLCQGSGGSTALLGDFQKIYQHVAGSLALSLVTAAAVSLMVHISLAGFDYHVITGISKMGLNI